MSDIVTTQQNLPAVNMASVAVREYFRSGNVAQLSPEETNYWERFVSGLTPGNALVEQIQQFRFPDEPAAEEPTSSAESRADAVKSLLLQALRG